MNEASFARLLTAAPKLRTGVSVAITAGVKGF